MVRRLKMWFMPPILVLIFLISHFYFLFKGPIFLIFFCHILLYKIFIFSHFSIIFLYFSLSLTSIYSSFLILLFSSFSCAKVVDTVSVGIFIVDVLSSAFTIAETIGDGAAVVVVVEIERFSSISVQH